ncbi:MAG: nucleotidyltransferase domain-containing protein [Thermoanaerobaculia bacterium]
MSMEAELREGLQNREDVRFAVLFGSISRGSGGSDSDLDVAVEVRGADPLQLAAELSLALDRDVDIVDLSQAGYPLLQAILRDGVLVYEGVPGSYAQWRARAIAETETDRPWFERMRDAFLKRQAGTHRG